MRGEHSAEAHCAQPVTLILVTPEELALLEAQVQAAVASAWIAAIAALVALFALILQYLLLPKPVLYIEDVHRAIDGSDVRLAGVLANRGNADAFDVRLISWETPRKPRITVSPSHPSFPGMAVGELGASETREFGFGNSEYLPTTIQLQWRQAPFMRLIRRSRKRLLKPTHTRTIKKDSSGRTTIVFGDLERQGASD